MQAEHSICFLMQTLRCFQNLNQSSPTVSSISCKDQLLSIKVHTLLDHLLSTFPSHVIHHRFLHVSHSIRTNSPTIQVLLTPQISHKLQHLQTILRSIPTAFHSTFLLSMQQHFSYRFHNVFPSFYHFVPAVHLQFSQQKQLLLSTAFVSTHLATFPRSIAPIRFEFPSTVIHSVEEQHENAYQMVYLFEFPITQTHECAAIQNVMTKKSHESKTYCSQEDMQMKQNSDVLVGQLQDYLEVQIVEHPIHPELPVHGAQLHFQYSTIHCHIFLNFLHLSMHFRHQFLSNFQCFPLNFQNNRD
mmetsp:Transcript_10403/g.18758  ORF Transcript_10403/g.18758 Transcript_10403/m.18758 type:complete len:301 (+) Transcript_10403:2778-3680(+)